MINVIFWVIIVVCIVRYSRSRSQRNNYGNGNNMGGTPRIDNRPIQNRQANNSQQPYYRPNQSAQQKMVQPTEEIEPEAGSTMAYLEEKARQDAMEHAREKREEARRLNQTYGGLRAAQRCYEGDSVPRDKRCIVCSYCGANNLVPLNARERYSCYFCREAL